MFIMQHSKTVFIQNTNTAMSVNDSRYQMNGNPLKIFSIQIGKKGVSGRAQKGGFENARD